MSSGDHGLSLVALAAVYLAALAGPPRAPPPADALKALLEQLGLRDRKRRS